jgi:uncharacterized protein YneF (UPF0154 family)
MLLIIASTVGSFVFGALIGYFLAKHNFLSEQIQRDAQLKNTEIWVDYLNKLGGTR